MTSPAPLSIYAPITRATVAVRFAAFEAATTPQRLELARALWQAWQVESGRDVGLSQFRFLTAFCGDLAAQGVTRSPERLYASLYCGAALEAGFSPADLAAGEPIGKALDRLGLSVEQVRAHLDAGTLQEALSAARAPTVTARLTTATKDTLELAAKDARTHLNTDALSDPEVRAILPAAYANAAPHIRLWLLHLGNGDIDPEQWELRNKNPDDRKTRDIGKPLRYVPWGKQFARCRLCGKRPAETGRPHEAHHEAVGEHEARPGDDTPPKWSFVCTACHIPQPGGPRTVHSRAEAIRSDPDKLLSYLDYDARNRMEHEAYQQGDA